MTQVTYTDAAGESRTLEATAGDSVMETAVRNGVPGIVAECGGSLSCATCHVFVDETDLASLPAMEEMEDEMLWGAAEDRRDNSRLSLPADRHRGLRPARHHARDAGVSPMAARSARHRLLAGGGLARDLAARPGVRRPDHPARRREPPSLPAARPVQGVAAGRDRQREADVPHRGRTGPSTASTWSRASASSASTSAADGSGVAHSQSGATLRLRPARARQRRPATTAAPRGRRPARGALPAQRRRRARAQGPGARRSQDVVVIGGGFIGIEAAASLNKMGRRGHAARGGPATGRACGGGADLGVPAGAPPRRRHRGRPGRRGASDHRRAATGSAASSWPTGASCPPTSCSSGSASSPTPSWPSRSGSSATTASASTRRRWPPTASRSRSGTAPTCPTRCPGAPEGDRVRFESVNNAIEQAKVAAYAITGRREEYAGIPWFWTNQGALKLQIAGLSTGHDRTLVRARARARQALGPLLPGRAPDRRRLRQPPARLHGRARRARPRAA